SRHDVLRALGAPHVGEDEPVYPGTCRTKLDSKLDAEDAETPFDGIGVANSKQRAEARINWRFRVPDGEVISFVDGFYGPQQFVAGKDFGDFVVWRHDQIPAYQLAVVVDDAAMGITEVVRGEDLLRSTARQILLYRALAVSPPQFYHCPLVTDESGVRLAKRHDSLSLRALRERGKDPAELRKGRAP
ncbi:MAG TPA: glutamate--tRNA ligase family protein, partial [Clostridia bacterium]|nr:glutamate--tRNA ligase family protein [Clostridia bacterium]